MVINNKKKTEQNCKKVQVLIFYLQPVEPSPNCLTSIQTLDALLSAIL